MSHWTDFAFSGLYCLALLALVFRYKRNSGISLATENKAERLLITGLMFVTIWGVSSGELELNLGYGRALLFSILWWATLATMAVQVAVAFFVWISSTPASFNDHGSAK